MTDIFCKLLPKNHKQYYRIKKLLYKTIERCRIKSPSRAQKGALFNCMDKFQMDHYGYFYSTCFSYVLR